MKRIVDSNEKGPEQYIHVAYGNYKAILEKPFGDSFEETSEASWDEHEKVALSLSDMEMKITGFFVAV